LARSLRTLGPLVRRVWRVVVFGLPLVAIFGKGGDNALGWVMLVLIFAFDGVHVIPVSRYRELAASLEAPLT
jgi:hypothetical protein